MEINEKEYQALDRLRFSKVAAPAHQIQQVLLKYYPMGTKIIIDKDCWRIEKGDK